MLSIFGFVDVVKFSYNGYYGDVMLPQQLHCNVLHRLTSRLHRVKWILS